MEQPGLRPGAMVRSLAGRDQGTNYIVLRQVDERHVVVANGILRSTDRPKIKNRRHLEVLSWADAALCSKLERGDKVSDNEIKKALEALLVLEEV